MVKVTRSKITVSSEMSSVTRNAHVQYESPISSGQKVMAKVKLFQKYVKLQGQGHKVKNYDSMCKVFSQAIHMCNTKALSLLVRKLWPRLKFLFTHTRPESPDIRPGSLKIRIQFIVITGQKHHIALIFRLGKRIITLSNKSD